jgi:hypothetical protein
MLNDSTIITLMPAVDLRRADHFYREILGLTPINLSENAVAEGLIAYRTANGTQLALYQRGPTTADHTVLEFVVSDLESLVDGLSAKGVVFEQYDLPGFQTDARGIVHDGQSLSAWFKDTEGNILSLSQP